MGNLVASRRHVCEAVPGISEGTGEALTKSQAHIALLSAELAKTKKLLQDSDLGVASICSLSRVNFSVLTDSGKRKRCAGLSGQVMDICKTIESSQGSADDMLQHYHLYLQRAYSRSAPLGELEEIKKWRDNAGGVLMLNTGSKMQECVSNAQYHNMRRDNHLQEHLAPVYLVKKVKKLGSAFVQQQMGIKLISFKAEDEGKPDIHGTSVFFKAVVDLAVEMVLPYLKKAHLPIPAHLKFKITLDSRPLGGRDQVAVGLVPLFGNFKAQSSKSVLPLILFNGKETTHNLVECLKELAADMNEIKAQGIDMEADGTKTHHTVSYILCVDMSSLWKIFGGNNAGDLFCTWCCCDKDSRHEWENPKWQEMRTDLVCIFPVSLTEVVFCGLHPRMRLVSKLLKMLGQQLYNTPAAQGGGKAALDKLIKVVKEECGISCFNMPVVGDRVDATALIGTNCTKVLKHCEAIITKVELTPAHLSDSLLIWTSIAWLDLAMRASAEDVEKTYTQEAVIATINKCCSAYTRRYSTLQENPNFEECSCIGECTCEEGDYSEGLQPRDFNFYLHTIMAHLPMMLKEHGALGWLSQEGFEAHHKTQRQIYAKATNRDGGAWKNGRTSSTQILLHQYWVILYNTGRLNWQSIGGQEYIAST